jgi:hypothetical protein
MLAMRSVAGQSPAVAQTIPAVLQRLAGVRKSVGLDGPQQLMDFTAPPADMASAPPPAATAAVAANVPAAPLPTTTGAGLTPPEIASELASVPAPQRALAAMLPLTDLPPGWEVGKAMGSSGKARLETFNAENLFEKINGRAESFIQFDVKGMAYTFYHPIGDESGEVQLYIFEMGSALNALGKYGSEKPDGTPTISLGSEGYAAAGSTFFYAGSYYTQLVSNKDEPKYAAFALELAKRVAAKQKPESGSDTKKPVTTPEAMFALLPAEPKRTSPKYVSQDVFGYSFLDDVFLADYQDGANTWQGFVRPYASADDARAIFEKYVEGAKKDGADLKMMQADGADRMVVSSNVGLIDVIFLKGNVIGGANGATDAAGAEAFAKSFLKSLPASVPAFEKSKKNSATEGTENTEDKQE